MPLQHDDPQHGSEAQSPTDNDYSSEQGLLGWERQRRSTSRHAWIPFTLLVLVSNLLSAIMGAMLGEANVDLNKACSYYTSDYSAVLKDVKIEYAPQHFNGSLLDVNIYREPPSPAVDTAWEELGIDYRATVISYDEGIKNGLTPAHVQRDEKYGGGFFVNVEGMHHLHCLNLVRQAAYFNYQYYKDRGTHSFKNEGKILELHITHCIDAIRQVLMCNVDTRLMGQVWYDKKHPRAFPDFNTKHTCKNYNVVRAWARERQLPTADKLPDDYTRRPDNMDDVLTYMP
ncbi:hypothetical protein B0T18DRAFT_335326 [Schizothecium vesticola]|uniref:Tat pathway signal sequence n=1 Tax=Schizothecium vesticola TaxID=314040 RepID=A0AA40EIG7_9PEZI|nr:hypothetical protein B0T18DRAFT_335326 [Schizothecium vesticola]